MIWMAGQTTLKIAAMAVMTVEMTVLMTFQTFEVACCIICPFSFQKATNCPHRLMTNDTTAETTDVMTLWMAAQAVWTMFRNVSFSWYSLTNTGMSDRRTVIRIPT